MQLTFVILFSQHSTVPFGNVSRHPWLVSHVQFALVCFFTGSRTGTLPSLGEHPRTLAHHRLLSRCQPRAQREETAPARTAADEALLVVLLGVETECHPSSLSGCSSGMRIFF